METTHTGKMSRRVRVGFMIPIVLAIVFLVVVQPISGQYALEIPKQPVTPNNLSKIVLANDPAAFDWYNTNGTVPILNGNSAVFFGSDSTNSFSDVVSRPNIGVNYSLVLQASAAARLNSFSKTGYDQLAIFAADSITNYKGDEFGFVLPETGNTWYAYVQSPNMNSWYVWTPCWF